MCVCVCVSSLRISLITAVLSTFLIPQEDGESERVTGREREREGEEGKSDGSGWGGKEWGGG